MIYGNPRVSTDGQSVAAQVQQLTAAGCAKVFREVASGAKTDRAQLRRALAGLEADDVLMVTRRPACALDAGPAQHPRHHHRPEGGVSLSRRYLG